MTVTGTIVTALPETSGIAKSGTPWRKREYVLETKERYPKKICLTVMNSKIEELNLQAGATYSVDFDLESREFNGKWYHTITAYRAVVSTM